MEQQRQRRRNALKTKQQNKKQNASVSKYSSGSKPAVTRDTSKDKPKKTVVTRDTSKDQVRPKPTQKAKPASVKPSTPPKKPKPQPKKPETKKKPSTGSFFDGAKGGKYDTGSFFDGAEGGKYDKPEKDKTHRGGARASNGRKTKPQTGPTKGKTRRIRKGSSYVTQTWNGSKWVTSKKLF